MIFLNQMAGPLFRELSEFLANELDTQSVMKTGHPDTLSIGTRSPKLQIKKAPPYDRSSMSTRIISWVKFAIHCIPTIFFAKSSVPILAVTNPPIIGPLLWLSKKIKGNPYYILVYDIHPETLISFGKLDKDSLIAKAWKKFNKKLYEEADAVITLGPHMAKTLSSSFDLEKTRYKQIDIIPPWADTDTIKPIPREENPLIERFAIPKEAIIILYSGNMGITHDIESILTVAKQFKDKKDVFFLLIGEGEKWEVASTFQRKNALDNLKVYKFLPEELLKYSMPLADISLVTLDKGAEGLMIPSKVFYYLAAGSAVIGICSGENELKDVIISNNAGAIVSPGSPELLKSALERMIANKDELAETKRNSRNAAVEKYSKGVNCKAFLDVLSRQSSFREFL